MPSSSARTLYVPSEVLGRGGTSVGKEKSTVTVTETHQHPRRSAQHLQALHKPSLLPDFYIGIRDGNSIFFTVVGVQENGGILQFGERFQIGLG